MYKYLLLDLASIPHSKPWTYRQSTKERTRNTIMCWIGQEMLEELESIADKDGIVVYSDGCCSIVIALI